jgi:hypothetical protein
MGRSPLCCKMSFSLWSATLTGSSRAYPTGLVENPASYWWEGTTATPSAGNKACAAPQITPMTVRLRPIQDKASVAPTSKEASLLSAMDGGEKKDTMDGTNYYAVPQALPPKMDGYRSSFPNDAVLRQCKIQIDSPMEPMSAGQDITMTGALFVTVTETRTETNCHPGIACNVRRESSETGGLAMPPASIPPPPQTTLPSPPHGPVMPKGSQRPHNSDIKADTLRAEGTQAPAAPEVQAGTQAVAGANRGGGVAGALTVKTEHSASGLAVPTSSGRKPPLVDPDVDTGPALAMHSSAPVAMSMVSSTPQPTPTLIRSSSASPSRPSLTIGDSAFSVLPLVTMGAHTEESAGFQIGSQTLQIGETLTINNHPVIVTTSAGATFAIVQDLLSGSNVASTIALNNLPNAALVGGAGGVFAPKPAAVGSASPVTAFNAVLTPSRDGGFIVSGSSLKVNGPPVTLGSGPSPTVLSLTTNFAGQGVLVANSESTTLPVEFIPSETARPEKPVGHASSASTLDRWLLRHSNLWWCGWTVIWGLLAR